MSDERLEDIVVDEEGNSGNSNGLSASSIALSMTPMVIVSGLAMAFGQDYASKYTNNHHGIVAAGMAAQMAVRTPTYVSSHFFFNRKRLMSGGKIDWKRMGQDAASLLSLVKVGSLLWVGSCVGISEYLLHQGYSPFLSGTIAGLGAGTGYALFMSSLAPKVDYAIDSVKERVKKGAGYLTKE